jgi:hypothetical protein
MKKFLVVAVVLAIACMSSMAFAADVTINGYVDVRSRNFQNFDLNKNTNIDTASRQTTETAFRLDVNVKAENAKAKLSLWNDHDQWNGKVYPDGTKNDDGTSVSTAFIREAWIDLMIPDTPVGIKAGHQLIQIANGWFFRSNYGGSDAWIVYSKMGNNTFALQDVKVREGANINSAADDADLYTAMGSMKMGDKTLGIDLSVLRDNAGVILVAPGAGQNGEGKLYNLGLNFNGKVGPATLKAEVDLQNGKAKSGGTDVKYSGNQFVVQASMPMDKLTLNATVARGSGDKTPVSADKREGIVNLMDIGQHYTLIYEYRIRGAAGTTNTGFRNTTALEVGAMFQATKTVAVGADLWFLQATEKTNINPIAAGTNGGANSSDLGTELDVKLNWQITKEVSWNWQLGYFAPGAAYQNAAGTKDAAYGAQGILSMSF